MSIARTLVAALAVTALAVPAAQAQPTDMHASVAEANAKAQQKQDLRAPDNIPAGQPRGHGAAAVNAPGATAVDSATGPAPRPQLGPPTWPVNPQPIGAAPANKVTDRDSGPNWTAIALGIAGSLLAMSGLAALTTHRTRRAQRPGIPA